MRFWRTWTPTLRSERAADQRNQISSFDCMGIVGISLEFSMKPNWVARLTESDARLATKYATLELNGFPNWLAPLSTSHPTIVREVLMGELQCEIADIDPDAWRDMLQKLADAEESVVRAVAEPLFELLTNSNSYPAKVLQPLLTIVRRGLSDFSRLQSLLESRFELATVPAYQAIYAAALFSITPGIAVKALMRRLEALNHELAA